MIAGLTTLNLLKEDKDLFQRLDGKTERLHQGMKTLIETKEYPTNSTVLYQCCLCILPKNQLLISKQPL